jgi:hypothetical protein
MNECRSECGEIVFSIPGGRPDLGRSPPPTVARRCDAAARWDVWMVASSARQRQPSDRPAPWPMHRKIVSTSSRAVHTARFDQGRVLGASGTLVRFGGGPWTIPIAIDGDSRVVWCAPR